MLYIHQSSCISPQQTFSTIDITTLKQPVDKRLKVIEPAYDGIPPGILRRMSKAVRIGMGAALPLLIKADGLNGIIIGTANAGMEDSFHFLKQIVDYNEGQLTPGNFVQSTPNALAAQLGMFTRNKGYNITHVHLGLAFENALIDAAMMVGEHKERNYLVGAVDDIASYNYTMNALGGWYKTGSFPIEQLYDTNSPGSIAGEAAAMFWVNGNPPGAIARVLAVGTLHSTDEEKLSLQLKNFIEKNLPSDEKIDLLISGEDGDNRLLKYYLSVEKILDEDVEVMRFKHLCGEYPTAAAMAVWLACYVIEQKQVPAHLFKKASLTTRYKNILIYNNYKGAQHSFILLQGLRK